MAYQYQMAPVHQANFDTNRSLLKVVIFSFFTLGIYGLWVVARSGEDLNTVASRWDNTRTMNYWLLALLIGPITLGIGYFVWWHLSSNRIGNELYRRGLRRTVTAGDFWLWNVLGSLIVIGPFIFMYKWLHAMNELCAHFNVRG